MLGSRLYRCGASKPLVHIETEAEAALGGEGDVVTIVGHIDLVGGASAVDVQLLVGVVKGDDDPCLDVSLVVVLIHGNSF